MAEAEQPAGDASSREELPNSPLLLSNFYLPAAGSLEANMITHPALLDSYQRELEMKQRMYMEPVVLEVQLDRMRVLLRELKRRSSDTRMDYDRMLQLAKENATLTREVEKLRQELTIVRQELSEKTELLTLKGVFALKVKFSQARDEFVQRLVTAEAYQATSLKTLASRVRQLEKLIAANRLQLPVRYRRNQLSEKALPAHPPEQSLKYEGTHIRSESRSPGRRNRIFHSPSKQTGEEYRLKDEQGNTLTKGEVDSLKETVAHYSSKLDILIGELGALERSQCKNSSHSHPETMKVQALLAESRIAVHDSSEYLQLLQRISVLRTDFNALDHSAVGVAKSLQSNPVSERLIERIRRRTDK